MIKKSGQHFEYVKKREYLYFPAPDLCLAMTPNPCPQFVFTGSYFQFVFTGSGPQLCLPVLAPNLYLPALDYDLYYRSGPWCAFTLLLAVVAVVEVIAVVIFMYLFIYLFIYLFTYDIKS